MNHLVQVMPLDSLSPGKQERPLLLAQSSGSPWDLLSSSTFPPDFPYLDQLSKDVLHRLSFRLPQVLGAVRASSQTSNVLLYGECCLKLADCGPMECADTENVVYKGCLVCGYLEFSCYQSSSDSPSSTCCGICSIPECCCSPESMEYQWEGQKVRWACDAQLSQKTGNKTTVYLRTYF